jgi:hypothetical protein
VQSDILEKHPDAKLKVYAVWFNMIRTDSRWLWYPGWLDDPRVVHFWDDERLVGRFYAENVTRTGTDVEWDVYFLYGADASWQATPPDALSSGGPIQDVQQRLREALDALLDE